MDIRQIENDINGNKRFQFGATLLSLGKTVLKNSNGKNYRVGSIEFADKNGEVRQSSCMIYEGNYNHKSLKGKDLEVGTEYLTTATLTVYEGKPSVIVQLSHLPATAPRAEADWFAEEAEVVNKADVRMLETNPVS